MNKKNFYLLLMLLLSTTVGVYFYNEYSFIQKNSEKVTSLMISNQSLINNQLETIENDDRKQLEKSDLLKKRKASGVFCYFKDEVNSKHSVVYLNNGILFFSDNFLNLDQIKVEEVISSKHGGLYSMINSSTLMVEIISSDKSEDLGTSFIEMLEFDKSDNLIRFSVKHLPEEIYSKADCGKITPLKKKISKFLGSYCTKKEKYERVEFKNDFYINKENVSTSVNDFKGISAERIGRVINKDERNVIFETLLSSPKLSNETSTSEIKILEKNSRGEIISFAPAKWPEEIFSSKYCVQ